VSEDDPFALPEPEPAPPEPAPRDEIFWGWHDVFLFVFIMIVSLGMALWAATGLRVFFHLSEQRLNMVLVAGQFVAYGIAFTCLKLMFAAEYGKPLLKSLQWRPSRVQPTTLLFTGLGLAFTTAMLELLMGVPQKENPMSRLMADRPTATVLAVLAVTIAPVAEELAFRGLLQPLMIRLAGVVPGILGTAVLFGAMHFEQYGSWQSVVLVGLAGAGFGAMRHLTGSTKAAAIMHAGYNSALFILFFTQKGASH
jgi:hypothetical protein